MSSTANLQTDTLGVPPKFGDQPCPGGDVIRRIAARIADWLAARLDPAFDLDAFERGEPQWPPLCNEHEGQCLTYEGYVRRHIDSDYPPMAF